MEPQGSCGCAMLRASSREVSLMTKPFAVVSGLSTLVSPVTRVSSAVALIALVGCNSAPIAPVIQIAPDAPTTVDDLELEFLTRSEDPNLDQTVSYDVRWYLDGEEAVDLAQEFEVPHDLTAKDQQWRAVVQPIDSEGLAGQAAEAVVVIQNTAPTVAVEVTPAEPGSYDDLSARVTGEDIDGDELTYRFQWLVNGVERDGFTEPTVSADDTAKGELWTVRAWSSDGDSESEPDEATVSIGNALPVAVEVTLDPLVAYEDTVVTAHPVGEDEDGDDLTWTFTWYVDDVAVPAVSGDSLDGTHFDKHQRITVAATPHDDYVAGEPVLSDAVRVLNTAPSLAAAALSPGVVREADTVVCLGSGFADIDGDPEGFRFRWLVEGAEASTDPSLDGSKFDKGDTIQCELSPWDGEDAGTPVLTDTLTIQNTAPVLTAARIDISAPKEGDTLSVILTGAGDDDGDIVEFEYVWYVGGNPVGTGPTLDSSLFDKHDDIYVIVTPFDGTDHGEPVRTGTVTAVNTAPEVTSLVLTPSSLFTNDVLETTLASTDADGDTVTYSYAWYVDGSLVSHTGEDLDGADWFSKGQDVYVVVTPNDGDEDGTPVTSATIEVLNSIPEITSVDLDPTPVAEETRVTCVPDGWFDEDEDAEDYEYAWYVEGRKVGSAADLDGDFFDRGDEIWCEVTPYDGEDRGTTVVSARVTIANTAPTIDAVSLSDTAPVEGDTLYATIVGADDVDGDTIDFAYAWYVNGTLVSTADELDSGSFGKGDTIYVIVTPSDDADDGVGVRSDTATVGNTAPVVTGVTLAPTSPYTNNAVTATVTSSDADGDTVTYSYAWYVDGSLAASTGATLATSDFIKNQDIKVIVTPNDGDDDGAPYTSSTIRSVNTVPSISGVSISPSSGIREDTTLTCVPSGWSDVDADPEGYRYQWRVDGSLVAVTSTLSGSFFSKGDSITCTAIPNDGEDDGSGLTSAAVSVDNSPPELDSVTLSTTSPQEGDTITATLGAATDADGDRITYKYSWRVNGVEVSTATSLGGADFDKGDSIELVVTPTDGTDDGDPVTSSTAVAINTVPEISALSLSPTSPTTTDAVTVSITSSDADGDSLTYTYAWYVEGTKVAASGATLASSYFSKGEEIYVIVTPNDGDDDGAPVTSATIEAINTAPSISGVSLSPTSFGEGDTVTCLPTGWSDADGDTASYRYTWRVNGAAISVTSATLTSADFDKGDTVQCQVTPFDGEDVGSTVGSAVVTVGNTAPTLASATITPSSPVEASTLSVTLGSASDADGDTITFDYAWYVDGTFAGSGLTLSGTDFDKGDVIYVEVTPSDGTDDGTTVTSASVTVGNTAPVVTAVTLSPTSAGTDTVLTATPIGSDVDGDSLTYSYAWYVEGTKVAPTGSTLDGGTWFDKGDEVYVIVIANDGTDSSAPKASSTLEIGNSAPSISGVTMSPSTIYETTTVSCSASGWSDPDGDAPGYRYAWSVNGSVVATSSTLTGSSFKKGDRVLCRMTPFDGTDAGAAVSSSAVTVSNSKPVLASATLSDTAPSEGDTLSIALGSTSDADGDTVTVRYAWYVNGSLVSSAATLSSAYFGSGDSVYAIVTPYDGTETGTGVRTATATVTNTAPVISSVTLSPTSPRTNDTIAATVSASDADGDTLTISYAWTVDGVSVSETSSRLSGSRDFDKGEDVQVTVTVSDGTTSVSATSSVVTVANTPPKVASASLSNYAPKEGDTVTCLPSGPTDADGDTVTYRYQWLVDGVAVGVTSSTLTSASFDAGDSVVCRVTPWDGDDVGTSVDSPAATVQNTAPVATGVALSDTSPATTDSVTATVSGVSDADGDTVTLRYQWYVGGSLKRTTSTTSRTNTLAASEFVKNQDIYVVVTPYDGTAWGSSVTSTTGRSVNTPAVISATSLTPNPARTANGLSASVTASDADADSLTYTWAWFVQNEGSGSFVRHASTSSSLPSSAHDKDDRVYFQVSVNDGETTTGPVSSAVLTIANTAPGTPGRPSISPSSPNETHNLTCSGSGASDVDGDSLTYQVQWVRNGSVYATYTVSSPSHTVSSSATAPGQSWYCRTRARDSSGDYGSWSSNSSAVSITSSLTTWSGVRKSVSVSSLSGWSVCHTERYNASTSLSTILSRCNRANLMLACRPVGSGTLTVAAHAPRGDVTYNTGTGSSSVHRANGVDWYYNGSYSWGFAPAGAEVNRRSCDWANNASWDDRKLCWHTGSNSTNSGWSCGTTQWLNGSTAWERVILHAN